MADKPVDEIIQVDAALDALPESPSASDVYEAVLPFSNAAVSAAAANRALSGGGGGSLPAWFQYGSGPPVDTVTPVQAGAVYFDTTNGGIYSAVGTTDTDWISLGGVGNIGSATGLSLLAGDTYLLAGDRDDPNAIVYMGSAYAQWNGHSQGLKLNFGAGEGNEQFVLRAGSTGQFTVTLLDGLGQSVFPGQTTIQGPLIVSSLAAPAELQNSQAALYFNDNDGSPSLEIIAKTANGTVVTGEVALA